MQDKDSSPQPEFLPAQIGNMLPEIELSEIDGEPRVRDLDVAQRLGFERDRKIRELIERNIVELETFSPLALRRGKSRGQEFTEYWLTEEQALLVASRSDAENAPEVRRMLIKVFVAWRRGRLSGRLPTTAEAFASVFQMVADQERQQAQQRIAIAQIETRVDIIEQTAPLKAKPQNAESRSEIRKRMNDKYGLSGATVDKVLDALPYSVRPAGMVKNSHEDAQGSSYAVYWIRDMTALFKRFVGECQKHSETMFKHPDIIKPFKMAPPG